MAQNNPAFTETIIRITGIEANNDLKIDGGDKSKTAPNNQVIWEIATNLVSEIYLVLPEHDPSTIFHVKPDKTGGSWKGQIKGSGHFPPGSQTEEKYTIIYKKQLPDTKLYIYDPIIQVNA